MLLYPGCIVSSFRLYCFSLSSEKLLRRLNKSIQSSDWTKKGSYRLSESKHFWSAVFRNASPNYFSHYQSSQMHQPEKTKLHS